MKNDLPLYWIEIGRAVFVRDGAPKNRTSCREHLPNSHLAPEPYTICPKLDLVCFRRARFRSEPIFHTPRCLGRYSNNHQASNPRRIRLRILAFHSKWGLHENRQGICRGVLHDVHLHDRSLRLHHARHELLEMQALARMPSSGWQQIKQPLSCL